MSKIVYLLGAGASFGLRDKDNSTIGVHDVYEDSEIIGTYVKYEYANIIEGLPLVSEIPGRLAYIIDKIKNCSCFRILYFSIFSTYNTTRYTAL